MEPKMPSSPNKVFDQLVDAKTIESPERHRSLASMELAPPPSSSTTAAALPPNKSISNNVASSSAATAVQPLPFSPNGKVYSHVEMAQNISQSSAATMKQEPLTTKSSSSTAMQDTVERIVNAVENREASSRESALVNGTTTLQQTLEVTHGGPLTSTELSQLSLLCASELSSNKNNIGQSTQSYYDQSSSQWATVDGDLLASLAPLLRAHVTSAMRVDLVGEGLDVIAKTVKAESSPEKKSGPVITIHQVSAFLRSC